MSAAPSEGLTGPAGAFVGRRVLVTGAGSGIGRQVAVELAARGASVTLLDRDGDAAERASADARAVVGSSGGVAEPAACDVTDEDAVGAAIDRAAAAMSGIDGVVNAAGIDLSGGVDETSRQDWDTVLAVNATGPFLVCRAALGHLRAAGRSTVVNVASGAGLKPLADRPAYSASKAAVIALTKSLAQAEADNGLRANVVCPGAVDTPLLRQSAPADDEQIRAMLRARGCAIDRLGSVAEVAAAILFLAGWESSFVTGATLAVDGGRTLW